MCHRSTFTFTSPTTSTTLKITEKQWKIVSHCTGYHKSTRFVGLFYGWAGFMLCLTSVSTNISPPTIPIHTKSIGLMGERVTTAGKVVKVMASGRNHVRLHSTSRRVSRLESDRLLGNLHRFNKILDIRVSTRIKCSSEHSVLHSLTQLLGAIVEDSLEFSGKSRQNFS